MAVDILVLHYTELPLKESLDILRDGARELRVSSHYVLDLDGTAYRLVPEDRTAWHAGKSWWRGRESLNATSIGIEIVNLHGDRHDYPSEQIEALIELCREIVARHPAIVPRNVRWSRCKACRCKSWGPGCRNWVRAHAHVRWN